MIANGYRSFSEYFLDDYHSRARSVGVYNPMTDSHLRIVRMPSPVKSNCDAHDTISNGQYGAFGQWDTQQVCVRILLSSNVWQQFFGRSALLRQQETDLPPADLWCAFFLLLIGQYICLLHTLTRPPRAVYYTFQWFLMTSTAVKQRCERCRTPWQHLLFFALLRSFSNNSATHKIIYVMSGRHAKNFKFVY
ncbi:hypothetical protein TNCV_468681 [Trichonephila clavipes]|nr:hypothetical protein TNCV_468681 [Trichonephila clavipes]